ncbi:MAG: KH domain-containing protein [Actinomycetota bacterium]
MAEAQGDQEGQGVVTTPADSDPVSATLAYLARALVSNVDDVRIERTENERGPVYKLHVNPDDMVRVIGKGGRVARSIRQVARAAAARAGTRAFIEIGD